MSIRLTKMAENREKLIAAARKAFAQQGYAAASMDHLTAEAGLTRGALYHNLATKEGCLRLLSIKLTLKWRTMPSLLALKLGMYGKPCWLRELLILKRRWTLKCSELCYWTALLCLAIHLNGQVRIAACSRLKRLWSSLWQMA